MRRRAIVLGALALLATASAPAKKIYKIVDQHGITHYTDKKPPEDAKAEVIKVRAEQQRIAALRLEGLERERRAVVSNRLAGAIEIELSLAAYDNIEPAPALPLRLVIPGDTELDVATLRAQDPRRSASFSLQFDAVPGDPSARPDDTVYRLPVAGDRWRIDQGFYGSFSHNEPQSRYAIDLAVDEGTPVLAAREGVVMQVEDDFEGAGLDREKYGSRANHVRVLHPDGTMAVYAHLQPESVALRPGQRVRTGQRLGASGNTGYSTGPHLHFALQVNRGMQLVSIPFRLEGTAGRIAIPGE